MAISMALFFTPLPSHLLWPGCILEYTICQLMVKYEGEDRVMSIVFCLFAVIAYWIHLTTTEIKTKTILSHEYLTYITSLE